jgi:regulator of sigma E protease
MLGVLVFVHELGHFLVAKSFKVKVLKFSLGFGPRLLSRTYGETEYMVCAVPLGGYVQMLGEGKGEEGEEAELSPEEEARSFARQTPLKRIAIISAGPLMNLLLPFVVLPLAFLVGVEMPAYIEQPACIGYVAADSDAGPAGFQAGDCLIAIGGDAVGTWNDANMALLTHAGSDLSIRVQRGEQTLDLTMQPENSGLDGLQSLGLFPLQAAIVGSLYPGMPARAAGIQVGDRILTIDGAPVTDWYAMKLLIQAGGGKEQTYRVERDGAELALNLTPQQNTDGGDYLVGISPQQQLVTKRYGLVESVQKGAEQTRDIVTMTMVFIKKLFSGDVSTDNIGGPITVVKTAGEAAQVGFSLLLSMLAFLSIQLGILNLLPIPILDGGHIFFSLYELIFRRPLALHVREVAQQVGLLLLLGLMVLAFYNDIMRLLPGGP